MTDELVKTPPTGGEVTMFAGASDFGTVQRMAKALASSTLVPKDYQGERGIPNVMIAMEIAQRLNASVFAVMQSLDVIHGRPSWRASALIAFVNASGKFSPLRFKFVGERGTQDWGCYAYAKSKIDDEVCEGDTITLELAKAEGWSTKNGSKWRTMPGQMLRFRAAAFWARVYCPELALGMHTSDEAQDVQVSTTVRDLPPELAPGDTKALQDALLGDDADEAESVGDDVVQEEVE